MKFGEKHKITQSLKSRPAFWEHTTDSYIGNFNRRKNFELLSKLNVLR